MFREVEWAPSIPAMHQTVLTLWHLALHSVMGAGCSCTRRAMAWSRRQTAACGCATAASWVGAIAHVLHKTMDWQTPSASTAHDAVQIALTPCI